MCWNLTQTICSSPEKIEHWNPIEIVIAYFSNFSGGCYSSSFSKGQAVFLGASADYSSFPGGEGGGSSLQVHWAGGRASDDQWKFLCGGLKMELNK